MNEKLRQVIENSRRIAFLGGAGLSTESGIPDFRSADGIYKAQTAYGHSPEVLLSHDFFWRHTEVFYDYYRKFLLYPDAKPNKAHRALAKLEQDGKLTAVITQNIDGLHQAAGSRNVLELHGSVHRNYCTKCRKFYPMEYILESEGVPTCSCGGVIKPDVVLYGEGLDTKTLVSAVTHRQGAGAHQFEPHGSGFRRHPLRPREDRRSIVLPFGRMIERNKENERELIMEECNHDCSNCSANCDSRDPKSFIEQPHPLSKVKKVVAVLSGKGGVGKSLVTSLLAVNTQRAGYRAAILDADVTGPSIPQAFGIHEKATGTEDALFASQSKTGIQMMSINLLLPDETSPVVWRGPVIAGAVKQFWTDVVWKDVDVLYVDMPPGTGDVPLTVMQSIPVDGIVVVTSPQELVGMIVEKAVKMAGLLNVPIVGIVENLSYFECPDCGKKHYLFGESHLEEIAKKNDIPETARIPIQPKLSAAVDAGLVELYEGPWLDKLTASLLKDVED